jgi:hypothetical protein
MQAKETNAGKGKKKRDPKEFAWKKIPPKKNEQLVKMVNKVKYNWCKYHKAWVIHEISACKLNPDHVTDPNEGHNDQGRRGRQVPENQEQLVLAKAYHAIVDDDDLEE